MSAQVLVTMALGFLACFLGAFGGAAAAVVWMFNGCPLPQLVPRVERVERVSESTRGRLVSERQ